MLSDKAKVLWDYLQMGHTLIVSDVIIVAGSHDTRVARRGAELYLEGYAPLILFSGGLGKLTRNLWSRAEAIVFSEIATSMGVPEEAVLIEDKSSNTGENVLFSKKLIEDRGIGIKRIIAVNKPYMERRMYSTFKRLWPDADIIAASPQIGFEEYMEIYSKGELSKDEIISIMVGDLQRIKLYPSIGYQIPQEIPDVVWKAFEELVKMGYTKHLIKA